MRLWQPPYFDQPFYVGFNVGGSELDLTRICVASRQATIPSLIECANAEIAFKRLLELGAKKHTEVQNVGEGILVATLLDPFGNVFGIIENPHFKIE
jgi:hypothetical protein